MELVIKECAKENAQEFYKEAYEGLEVVEVKDTKELELINLKCNDVEQELLAAFFCMISFLRNVRSPIIPSLT